MRTRRSLAAALVLALAGVPPAAASGGDDDARRHYELGQRHYNLGHFDRAIEEFQRAYELSPAPGLLFNIAQAYRARKDSERALYFYTTYLREDPSASERPYVEERMRELRASLPPAAAVQAAASMARAPGNHPGRGLKIAGVLTAGSGLALVGTAAYFGIRAGQDASDLSDLFKNGGKWDSRAAALYDQGQSHQTAAWIVGAAGVTAMAAGGILYYLGTRDRPVTVGAQAGPGEAGFSLRASF